jgi:hypothetical protein
MDTVGARNRAPGSFHHLRGGAAHRHRHGRCPVGVVDVVVFRHHEPGTHHDGTGPQMITLLNLPAAR